MIYLGTLKTSWTKLASSRACLVLGCLTTPLIPNATKRETCAELRSREAQLGLTALTLLIGQTLRRRLQAIECA